MPWRIRGEVVGNGTGTVGESVWKRGGPGNSYVPVPRWQEKQVLFENLEERLVEWRTKA